MFRDGAPNIRRFSNKKQEQQKSRERNNHPGNDKTKPPILFNVFPSNNRTQDVANTRVRIPNTEQ